MDEIAAMPDPVARNRRITRCYHELSAAVAVRAAPGANWCTFATWASAQAGITIRGEDLERAADDVLGRAEVRAAVEGLARQLAADAGPLLATLREALGIDAATRRASAAVAAGNLKVFAEIGREFARWLAQPREATDAFCDALRAGEPPEGQRLLADAFRSYASACAATDDVARAEQLLLGNLLVGLHEQTRLQPEISAAMDAAFDAEAARAALLAALLPSPWRRARAWLARRLGRPLPLDVAADALCDAVRRELRVVLTETLMTIHLPGAVVRLGRDVRGAYPPELRAPSLPALRTLLSRVDHAPQGPAGSGAVDWSSLDQRMGFIAELFRCWHLRAELMAEP